MKRFCDNYGLKTWKRKPKFYKNSENPTCTDLILTNVLRSFQKHMCHRERFVWLSFDNFDFMRKEYWKFQSRLISYRSYRQFSNEKFRENLLLNLSKESLVNDADGFQKFCDIGLETLDKLVLYKQKYVRSSQMPFLTKELSKEIVTRFRLRNNYLKHRNDTNRLLYTKQRNSCVSLLRKTKKDTMIM